MLFRVYPWENWSVSIDLQDLQRPRALMKIIQRFIIIATDNNSFSYIIIEIISLSLLTPAMAGAKKRQPLSKCRLGLEGWRRLGGIKSCSFSHCKRRLLLIADQEMLQHHRRH